MARKYIAYSHWPGLRRKVGSRAFDVVREFIETCTDSVGLSSISFQLNTLSKDWARMPGGKPPTGTLADHPVLDAFTRLAHGEEVSGEGAELAKEMLAIFPAEGKFRSPGGMLKSIEWEGTSRVPDARGWRAPVPPAPSHAAFAAVLERWDHVPYYMFVDFQFLFVDEQRTLLPYLDEDFENFVWSFMQLAVHNGRSSGAIYNLKLPWNEPSPDLSRFVRRLAKTIPQFEPARFRMRTPGPKSKDVALDWLP